MSSPWEQPYPLCAHQTLESSTYLPAPLFSPAKYLPVLQHFLKAYPLAILLDPLRSVSKNLILHNSCLPGQSTGPLPHFQIHLASTLCSVNKLFTFHSESPESVSSLLCFLDIPSIYDKLYDVKLNHSPRGLKGQRTQTANFHFKCMFRCQ